MLDKTNLKIIRVLQQDARISFAELGKAVHLSAPAVAERVKKLEAEGIITGYCTKLDLDKIGLPIVAHIQARVFLGKEPLFVELVKQQDCVLECANVTGEKAYLLKAAVPDMKSLDALLEALSVYAETNSMIKLSDVVTWNGLGGKQ